MRKYQIQFLQFAFIGTIFSFTISVTAQSNKTPTLKAGLTNSAAIKLTDINKTVNVVSNVCPPTKSMGKIIPYCCYDNKVENGSFACTYTNKKCISNIKGNPCNLVFMTDAVAFAEKYKDRGCWRAEENTPSGASVPANYNGESPFKFETPERPNRCCVYTDGSECTNVPRKEVDVMDVKPKSFLGKLWGTTHKDDWCQSQCPEKNGAKAFNGFCP